MKGASVILSLETAQSIWGRIRRVRLEYHNAEAQEVTARFQQLGYKLTKAGSGTDRSGYCGSTGRPFITTTTEIKVTSVGLVSLVQGAADMHDGPPMAAKMQRRGPMSAITAVETARQLVAVPPRIHRRAHIPALDGLRGIAILAVLMVHSVPTVPGSGTLIAALNSFFAAGVYGVDLFFVLSGFLITGILLDSKDSPSFFKHFYIRRFLRLFPVYYGFLVVLVTIVPILHHWARSAGLDFKGELDYHGNWWWYILYVCNWKPYHGRDPGLGHFWSLAVEEQFYLTWPLLVYQFSRRGLAWCCCGLCVASVTLRCLLWGSSWDVYSITITRLDALAVGALLALAARDLRWSDLLHRHWNLLAGVALSGFTFCVLRNWRHVWNPLSAFWAAALFGIVVFRGATVTHGRFQRLLRLPILQGYGKYSYCIYVVHWLIIDHTLRVAGHYSHSLSPLPTVLLIAACLVAANAIIYWAAKLSWSFYEAPILAFKDRFTGG